MKTTYPFPKNLTIVRLFADEGYKLTSYKPETEDIVFFDSFAKVTTTTARMSKYYEITDEQANEYARLRDVKLNDAGVGGIDDVYGENA